MLFRARILCSYLRIVFVVGSQEGKYMHAPANPAGSSVRARVCTSSMRASECLYWRVCESDRGPSALWRRRLPLHLA